MDERSYVIGLFDGEGCISTYKNKGSWTLDVVIVMGGPEELMQRVVRVWGGHYYLRSQITAGGLRLWQWKASGRFARAVLADVAELGIAKRAQALLGVQLLDLLASGFAKSGPRINVSTTGGRRWLTDDQIAERETLVVQIRALNGARSRFRPVTK
jgi:hypothetical protein